MRYAFLILTMAATVWVGKSVAQATETTYRFRECLLAEESRTVEQCEEMARQ